MNFEDVSLMVREFIYMCLQFSCNEHIFKENASRKIIYLLLKTQLHLLINFWYMSIYHAHRYTGYQRSLCVGSYLLHQLTWTTNLSANVLHTSVVIWKNNKLEFLTVFAVAFNNFFLKQKNNLKEHANIGKLIFLFRFI